MDNKKIKLQFTLISKVSNTLIIVLVTTIFAFAQNRDSIKLINQQYNFKKAENSLLKKEDENALGYYFEAYRYNSLNDKGDLSKIKVDSLKPLVRKRFIKEIKGKWLLLKYGSSWGYNNNVDYQILIIGKKYVKVYKKNRKKGVLKLILKEKITFNQINMNRLKISFTEFLFTDNISWQFRFNKKTNELLVKQTSRIKNEVIEEFLCGSDEYYYKKL